MADEKRAILKECPHGLPRYNPGAQVCADCLAERGTIYCPFNGKSAFDIYLGAEREYRRNKK